MTKTIMMASVFTAFAAVAADPAEYFVDGMNGNDGWDGTSSAYVSGTTGPKKTIQAAVDLTKTDDVVTVLPGVYDTGSRTYDDSEFRLVITNRIVVRSSAGRKVTHIVGRRAATATGMGEGGIRGVAMHAVPYIVLEGFTIRDCACSITDRTGDGNRYTGAATCGAWNDYVLDCEIRNCVAVEGAVGYRGTFVRCLIEENSSPERVCLTTDNAYYYNCVIRRNKCGTYLMVYPKVLCNCTVIENRPVVSLFGSGGHSVYNSLFLDNYGKQGDASNTSAYSLVTTSPASEFKAADDACVFGASRFQLFAPATGDWRLLSTSDAVGKGDSAHLTVVALYHENKTWSAYLAEKYRYRDYLGADISQEGNVNCGAIQGTVTAASGRILFGSELIYNAAVSYSCQDGAVNFDYSYLHAEALPSVLKVKAAFVSGAGTYAYTVDPHAVDVQLYQYSLPDGWLPVAFPAQGTDVTVKAVAAANELYVDKAKGSDSNDGSATNKAFRTLQAAVDAASTGLENYTLVHVAPGFYDEGGAVNSGSNRVSITKSLSLVADEGPETTFIVGAPDPETGSYGPNAVRCAHVASSSRAASIRGFTLTGGYTENIDGTGDMAAERGGALKGSWDAVQDCIISNNFAKSSVIDTGLLIRCKVVSNTALVKNILGTTKVISSLVMGNSVPAGKNTVADSLVIASTSEGNMGYGCQALGSILCSCIGAFTKSESKVSDGNVAWKSSLSGYVRNTLVADPLFVAAEEGDWRLRTDSPALGGARVDDALGLIAAAPSDVDGNPPCVVDGVPTAGACQNPVPVVVVDGRRDCLTVEGGALGTNVVARTITVTAAAPGPGGREFLGFTVDGVDLPASQTVWSYTAPSAWDGVAVHDVLARYGKTGLLLLFK